MLLVLSSPLLIVVVLSRTLLIYLLCFFPQTQQPCVAAFRQVLAVCVTRPLAVPCRLTRDEHCPGPSRLACKNVCSNTPVHRSTFHLQVQTIYVYFCICMCVCHCVHQDTGYAWLRAQLPVARLPSDRPCTRLAAPPAARCPPASRSPSYLPAA